MQGTYLIDSANPRITQRGEQIAFSRFGRRATDLSLTRYRYHVAWKRDKTFTTVVEKEKKWQFFFHIEKVEKSRSRNIIFTIDVRFIIALCVFAQRC